MASPRSTLLLLAAALLLTGCVSLDYDLAAIDIPISAKPADPARGDIEPFTLEATNILWAHGLGQSEPDVAALVASRSAGYDAIAGFRVRQVTGFHHWLLAHLSLTLVRMRTVVIEGQLVRNRP